MPFEDGTNVDGWIAVGGTRVCDERLEAHVRSRSRRVSRQRSARRRETSLPRARRRSATARAPTSFPLRPRAASACRRCPVDREPDATCRSYAVPACCRPLEPRVDFRLRRILAARGPSPCVGFVQLAGLRPLRVARHTVSSEGARSHVLCVVRTGTLFSTGRTVRRWRRRELNPGPRGFQLTFVHVRSRITQATGFVNSVTT